MTASGDGQAERPRESSRSPDDLVTIESNPSLRRLVGRGWHLDRLPVTSTGWAFVGSVSVSLLLAGFASATLVTIGMAVGLVFTAMLLSERDVGAARLCLRATRMIMIAWLVTTVAFAGLPRTTTDATTAHAARPSPSGSPCPATAFAYRPVSSPTLVCQNR